MTLPAPTASRSLCDSATRIMGALKHDQTEQDRAARLVDALRLLQRASAVAERLPVANPARVDALLAVAAYNGSMGRSDAALSACERAVKLLGLAGAAGGARDPSPGEALEAALDEHRRMLRPSAHLAWGSFLARQQR